MVFLRWQGTGRCSPGHAGGSTPGNRTTRQCPPGNGRFISCALQKPKLRNGDLCRPCLENHLDGQADRRCLGSAADNIAHHRRSFREFDQCNEVGRLGRIGSRYRSAHDRIAADAPATAGAYPLDCGTAAFGAHDSRIELMCPAAAAALQQEFAVPATLPERPGFRSGARKAFASVSAHEFRSLPSMIVVWLDMMPPCA